MNAKTISVRDALHILTRDVIVPGATDSRPGRAEIHGTGLVRMTGDLAGRPGHLASAVVSDNQNGTVSFTVSFTVRAVVPRRWHFSTITMTSMLTEENVEEFATHISSRIFAETQAPVVSV